MVDFISREYHLTIFVFLNLVSYPLVVWGILNLIFGIDLTDDIYWNKIAFFLSAAVLIFAASLFVTTKIIMFRPDVSATCESFVVEIDRIQEAQNAFCHSCYCYLYKIENSSYTNITNTNSNAAKIVTDCPNWAENEIDGKMRRLSQDLRCSGWCQSEPIFYFISNFYQDYDDYKHRSIQ